MTLDQTVGGHAAAVSPRRIAVSRDRHMKVEHFSKPPFFIARAAESLFMASAKAPCLMRAVGKDKLLKIKPSPSSPAILSVCGPAAATKMSGGFNGGSWRKPRAAGSKRKKSVSLGKSPRLTFRPVNISFKKRI